MSKLDELVLLLISIQANAEDSTGMHSAIRAYIEERFGPLMRKTQPTPDELGSLCQDCHKAHRGMIMPCPFCGSNKAQEIVKVPSAITVALDRAKQE